MSFRGSIEEVKEEVKNRIRDLAPGGGYILAPAHNLQPDTTPEKIYVMYKYAAKYGVYPISIN
jgi:uroporphyrinogen decarboxylase